MYAPMVLITWSKEIFWEIHSIAREHTVSEFMLRLDRISLDVVFSLKY